jgi:hypothetical protein
MICNIYKLDTFISRIRKITVALKLQVPLGSDNNNYDCSYYDGYDYNSLFTFGRLESDNQHSYLGALTLYRRSADFLI